MFTVTFYINNQELGSYISQLEDTHKTVAEARTKLNDVLPQIASTGIQIREVEIALEPLDLQLFLSPDWTLSKNRLEFPVPRPPKVMVPSDEEIIS